MKKISKKSKHAQAWGMDLIVASVIFTVGLVAFYLYALNRPGEAEETIDSLFYDGNVVASSVLSEGYPQDWNSGSVVMLGILNENRINETKLERFNNFAKSDYTKTKTIFNIRANYYFFLNETMLINSQPVEGIGSPPITYENLIKITRFTIYKEKPTSAYFYVWK